MQQNNNIEKQIDFKQYLNLAWKYKYVLVSIIFLFLIVGIVLYKLEIPVYSATAVLIYEAKNPFAKYSIKSNIDGRVIHTIAISTETISQVIKELDLYDKIIVPDLLTILKIKLGLENPYIYFSDKIRYYQKNIKLIISYADSRNKKGIKTIRITVNNQDPNT
ncbi:uncharacterized protein involved in exopolysaccharide biosynthesis, partial [Thermoplasmatales archaeon SCGC AB-539-C06]